MDAQTKAPLAFVSITTQGQAQGVLSDIDGKFRLPLKNPYQVITFSYLGYEPASLPVHVPGPNRDVLVRMKPRITRLQEVKITAGENPAHHIIKKVTANRDRNNPEKMHSFSYASYNKTYVTSDLSSNDTLNSLDTSALKGTRKLLERQHLFLTESVSLRKFLKPDRNYEKIIATRVSGFKESPFSMLATQMQSFAFYSDMINLGGKFYLNPVSKGSTNKYFFLLEDTTYSGNDTVYVISFRPKKGANFEGMKGVLYINTNGYAIQNVIAEPAEVSGTLSMKIQQQYAFVENKQWFPVQLNTDFLYNFFAITDSSISSSNHISDSQARIKSVGRCYIKDIVLNPELKKNEFGHVELETDPNAYNKSEEYWNKYREDPLTQKDKNTYHIIDSIGKEAKFDRKMRTYEALITGQLPYKWVNIDLTRILVFNDYEGFRPGIGLHTNDRISSWFSIGGYFAYGLKDKHPKYGSDCVFLIDKGSETRLKLSYINDVVEPGETEFLDDRKLLSSEAYRQYLVNWMDRTEQKEISFSFRSLHYLKSNVYLKNIDRTSTNKYLFATTEDKVTTLVNNYNFTECGIAMRYAFREKFMRTQHNFLVSLGTSYPIVWLQVAKGLNPDVFNLGGEFDYVRVDTKLEKSFFTKNLGKTTLTLLAGYIDGDLPNTYLYKGHGSYKQYTISSANSFETMRMNEFLSDRYASFFFYHDFGKLLLKTKKFQPEFVITSAAGIGSLSHPASHTGIKIRTMEKGYYESGLLINNLLNSQMIGLGLGFFYRYGPYAFTEPKDNLALKFSFKINL